MKYYFDRPQTLIKVMSHFPINKEKLFIFSYICQNNLIPKELSYFILNILYNSQKPKILISRELLPDNKISRFWVVENFVPNYPDIKIISGLLLKEPQIVVYGKVCHQNRNIGFFSNQSKGYKYSNQTIKSQPLDKYEPFKNLLSQVNDYLGTKFNGILVNEYIDGTKYLGAHSDSELGLDKSTKSVAGISFGATRKFRIRDRITKKIVLDYEHAQRTLIVMDGNFQKEYTHEIVVQKKIKECRISLTFRHHTE